MQSKLLRNRRLGFTLLVVGGLILASCSGSSDSVAQDTQDSVAETQTTIPEPTTTTIPVVRAPLTGAAAVDETVLERPAMVVKIDNHPQARPQWGLNQADIVFEENVEMLTRFAAVFHSQGSDPVGPIRSGRMQDINLLGSLNHPLFVWSGGNAQVTTAIRKSWLFDLSHSVANEAGGYRRESSRNAPHNLLAETTKLWTLAPADAKAPLPQFEYRADTEPVTTNSKPAGAVKISMDGVKVMWEWNSNLLSFLRSQDDKPHIDMQNVRINAQNVVLISVVYSKSGSSPVAKSTGSGEVWIYTAGVLVQGTWERLDPEKPFIFKDIKGQIIKLTPGRTWVEVIRQKSAANLAPGVDPMSVKYP
ncbi:putative lipoprotein YerB [Actinomycetes bacterium]|nr:putative lipoprotein YerB [Actinomycetes bacterium]